MDRKLIMEIPDDIYTSLSVQGYNEKKLGIEARNFLGAGLYLKKVLSLGRASEVAGMSQWSFIQFISGLGLPVIDYDDDEIQSEKDSIIKMTNLINEQ